MRIKAKFKNWRDYQAKADEKRPGDEKWRKIHRSFFSDYHVRKLSEQDRYRLIALIGYASLSTGKIDIDHDELCYEIGCKSFDISKFGHFLESPGSISEQNAAECEQTVTECDQVADNLQQNALLDKSRLDKSRSDLEESRSIPDGFDQFWLSYPKKVSKSKSMAKYTKILSDGVSIDEIMEGLQRAKESAQWVRDDGQYIPHPLTWLNNERWRDEDTAVNDLTGEVPRMKGLGL